MFYLLFIPLSSIFASANFQHTKSQFIERVRVSHKLYYVVLLTDSEFVADQLPPNLSESLTLVAEPLEEYEASGETLKKILNQPQMPK